MATTVGKIDLQAFARDVAELAGLKPAQAPGLAWLFQLVEKQAFCSGVLIARGGSFAADPEAMYREYRDIPIVTPNELPQSGDAVDPQGPVPKADD